MTKALTKLIALVFALNTVALVAADAEEKAPKAALQQECHLKADASTDEVPATEEAEDEAQKPADCGCNH